MMLTSIGTSIEEASIIESQLAISMLMSAAPVRTAVRTKKKLLDIEKPSGNCGECHNIARGFVTEL
jgi:hypothetical protein